ncbi:proprotein convertase subtilisin/kexin type 5-like [Bolinopsis microptera]|uniref:proprotein convertase subtilisin/kexin type 5-like n=1 Tax=Bolinopsis microptera TaxID=2820187 RepID=UPI00307A9DA6
MTSCETCDAGLIPNSDKTACESCPAGSYKNIDMNTCKECPDNTISSEGAALCTTCERTKCEPCGEGTYRNDAMTSCETCDAGLTPNSDKTACEPCPAGSYKNIGMNTCKECPDNTISSEGAALCTTCGPGQEQNLGRTACAECPAGSYKNKDMTSCETCETGWTPNTDKTACVTCPAGQYKTCSMITCELCPPGTFRSADMDATKCVSCTGNMISPKEGAIFCRQCDDNILANSDKTQCDICAPGWYSRNGGKEPSCLRCDPSEYQPYPQQTRCLACAGSVNREKTACLPVSANFRCGPISITLPWLNKGSPIEFAETWAGNRSSVNCPGDSYKKLYKECTVEGYWDDNTDTDECDSPLSSCLQSVLEVESDLNADKVHDLNKELNCVAEAGADIILSPRDTHEIVDLLSKLTKHPTSEVNELSLVMIRSMEHLRRGESKFLKESEKSEIIKILETVSKSNTEDNIITTDSIVLQSVTPTMSKEKPAINLTAPETVPADDLPIMLDFGNQRGQKINVAVMDESYKKMLPKPTTPNSTLGSPIVNTGNSKQPNFVNSEFNPRQRERTFN